MEFSREVAEDGTVMLLRGAFTFKDHHSFRALLDQLKTSPSGRRVLDLSHLEFLDSAALGMLLIADDEAKSGGWALTLRRPTSEIAKLIELACMDSLFTIER
jgi:anti-anti-sigma factor